MIVLSNDFNLEIGLADILIGGEEVGLQGDAAVFTATPKYIEMESFEAGGVVDYYLEGWEVKLKVVLEESNFEKMKLALPALKESKAGSNVVGLTDGGTHQRMRGKAKEITIHPRSAGSSEDSDITIFKAFPTGTYERSFGKEVVKYEVEFNALPLTSDFKKGGNYFRIGKEGIELP